MASWPLYFPSLHNRINFQLLFSSFMPISNTTDFSWVNIKSKHHDTDTRFHHRLSNYAPLQQLQLSEYGLWYVPPYTWAISTTVCACVFSAVPPSLWNGLPEVFWKAPKLLLFYKLCTIELFRRALLWR